MGCELSKSAKPKAPKYKALGLKTSLTVSRRVSPVGSSSPRIPSSVVGTVRSDRDPQDLPHGTDQSSSRDADSLIYHPKNLIVFDDITETHPITPVPADHILEEDILPQSGPLEHLPKSMFDEEVLVALATFEREHMLRKDCEFEAILAQLQGA